MAPTEVLTEVLTEALQRRDAIIAEGHSLVVAAWEAYMEFTALTSEVLPVLKGEVTLDTDN